MCSSKRSGSCDYPRGSLRTSTAGASAVYATITGAGAALHGYASGGYDNSWAVYGLNVNTYGYGVYASGSGNQGIGAYGFGYQSGVYGYGYKGVTALSNASNGYGLHALGGASSMAALFSGDVQVIGSFSASSKSFLIDHPVDPANRYLEHACVESSERKTIYDGVDLADDAGVLEVTLPDYFEALNRDVRYLLTPIGASAPDLHVRDELKNGRFVVAGARPRQKISWLVTGVRNDAYARAHPIVVEREKTEKERDLFLNPIEHGQPAERGATYETEKRARERAEERATPPAPPGAVTAGGTP